MIAEFLITLTVLVAILFLGLEWKKSQKTKTIPGPPFFRGVWELIQSVKQEAIHLCASKWADRYGDLVFVNALVRKVVFVNNAELCRKLFNDPSTRELSNDRPPSYTGRVLFYNYKDMLFGRYNKELLKRRKIFHHVLKFYGQGVNNFEKLMTSTSKELCHRLTRYEGDVSLFVELTRYIRWVVGLLLKGDETCEEDLDAMIGFIEKANVIATFETEIFLETFPFVPYIPGLWHRKAIQEVQAARGKLEERIFMAVRDKFRAGETTSIVADLLEQQAELQKSGNFQDMTDDDILGMVQDIAAAAYITTAGTLTSLFLQFLVDQKLQDRVYAEICEVIGDESPSFEHKRHMPYTEATILETLRYSSIVPLLLPHYANGDIHFEGHFIPKGTFLILNSWCVHHREDLWEDPWAFKPERFLDSDGQVLETDHPTRQNLLAFGAGKRLCPGENFARVRVFFIVVTLLQKFRFLPPEDVPLPSANPADWKPGVVISPEDYKCRLEPRGEPAT
ncbi:steroid 17-alpha-hydroxylase/17,20 lyase [Aplysia californica]|uniref:Steroid 17-alpha-hydroxylase/17,20 lyase n=1 Tax=Aplysia californica TaxID=6500 RepID=A0ABM1W2X9_APLCA|nr:steroid 17-alpha-hydroxylase/17,20 lyase [Aplysia californica]XP_035829022.1 steroid 17-alpha-hydroxylase/17,20 lyase [Aplysia californica]